VLPDRSAVTKPGAVHDGGCASRLVGIPGGGSGEMCPAASLPPPIRLTETTHLGCWLFLTYDGSRPHDPRALTRLRFICHLTDTRCRCLLIAFRSRHPEIFHARIEAASYSPCVTIRCQRTFTSIHSVASGFTSLSSGTSPACLMHRQGTSADRAVMAVIVSSIGGICG
jgi:hypothetical protein